MKNSEDGFALLEALIGLAIVGLLMTFVGGLLTTGTREAATARTAASVVDDALSFRLALTTLIENVSANPLQLDQQMVGREHELVVTSYGPPTMALEKPLPFALTTNDQKAVLLTWDDRSTGRTRGEELAAGAALSFRYYGRVDDTWSWSREWKQPYLPRLVEARLDFAKGDPIEVLVEVRSSLPDLCLTRPEAACPP